MKNYFIINPVAGCGKAIEVVEKQIEIVSEECKENLLEKMDPETALELNEFFENNKNN